MLNHTEHHSSDEFFENIMAEQLQVRNRLRKSRLGLAGKYHIPSLIATLDIASGSAMHSELPLLPMASDDLCPENLNNESSATLEERRAGAKRQRRLMTPLT